MEAFSRRRMLKKFYKACKKDMSRINSIISGMNYLYWQEGINNDFSTYNAFLELVRQITEITNNETRYCTIDKFNYRNADIINQFISNIGIISYLDCEAHCQHILVEDAQKLVPMPNNAMILNPMLGTIATQLDSLDCEYSQHLAVHTSLMNTYNIAIEFFRSIYK